MSDAHADNIRDRVVRGGLIYVLVRFSLQTFSWLTTLLVARLLVPEDYGLIAITAMVTEIAALLAASGFGTALVQRPVITRSLEGKVFTLTLALATVLYAVIWALSPWMASFLNKPDFSTLMRVVALTIWLIPLNTVCGALLDRELKLTSIAAILGLTGVVQAGVVLSLALADAGVWALAGGIICGALMQTAATWWFSGWRPILAWPGRDSASLVRFGSTVAATSLIWFAYSNADKVAVTSILGPVSLGLYAMAFQLVTLPVDKFTSSLNRIAYPVYCRLQSDRALLQQWYLRMAVASFALTAPALIGSALIADDVIVPVLGERWSGIVLPFQILSPVGALMVVSATLPPLLTALGRPDIPLRYVSVCVVVYPIALAGVAEFEGLIGVCAVWLVLYPLQFVGLVWLSREVTGISLSMFLKRLMPFVIALVVMSVVVIAIRLIWADDNVSIRVILSISVGAVTYLATAALLMGSEALRVLFSSIGGLLRGGRGSPDEPGPNVKVPNHGAA